MAALKSRLSLNLNELAMVKFERAPFGIPINFQFSEGDQAHLRLSSLPGQILLFQTCLVPPHLPIRLELLQCSSLEKASTWSLESLRLDGLKCLVNGLIPKKRPYAYSL